MGKRYYFKTSINTKGLLINSIEKAKRENNLILMKEIYEKNKNYSLIAFEYGKMLFDNELYDESKKVLETLIDTKDANLSLFILGKIETIKGNIKSAKYYYKKGMKEYNDDYCTFNLGMLNYLYGNNQDKKNAKMMLKNFDKESKIYEQVMRNLAIIYIKEKKYLEAMKIMKTYKNFNAYEEKILIILYRELGVIFPVDYNFYNKSYTNRQLFDYDEFSAIEHIIKKHANDGKNNENKHTLFNNNIDIYKLFNSIKKELIPENKIIINQISDTYLIKYPNVGYGNEKYIKVVTNPNTKEIITMYPLIEKEEVFSIFDDDENEIIDTKERIRK